MTITTSIRATLAALVLACGLAPFALAAGEPKNQWPFTRVDGGGSTYRVGQQAPGVRAGLGEPKNELPFNQPVVGPIRIATPADGFDWGDAGIGVGAGFGLALVLAGGLLLTQRRPRPRRTGAAAAG